MTAQRRKSRLTIFTFFALALTASWLFSLFFFFSAMLSTIRDRQSKDVEWKAVLALENLRQSASLLLKEGKETDIQRLVENAGANRLIQRIRVISLDQRIIASSNLAERGQHLESELVRQLLTTRAFKLQTPGRDFSTGYECVMPVQGGLFSTERGSDTIAVAQYVADIDAELSVLAEMTNALLVQSGLTYGIMLVLTLLLIWFVVAKPLRYFGLLTARIASGDYAVRMTHARNDEFLDFANLFNQMIEQISQKNVQLLEYSSSLELKVAERTESLAQANKNLLESQERLIQSERIAAVSGIVGGIAHEINNPAAFVFSNLETMSGYVDSISRVAGRIVEDRELISILDDSKDLVMESLQGMQRIRKIVSALQTITATSARGVFFSDLSRILVRVIAEVKRTLPDTVTINTSVDGELRVAIREEDLVHVLHTLLDNARLAVGETGQIYLTGAVVAEKAQLTVQDSGKGIAPEVFPKLFEPFFTTRASGQGVGLGLAVSRTVVERVGGNISAANAAGAGAIFTVTFPLVKD